MKRATRSNFAAKTNRVQGYLGNYARRNATLIALALLFLAGVFAGALLLRAAPQKLMDYLTELVVRNLTERARHNMITNFSASLATSLIYLGILFFCGFCALGQPAEAAVPFSQGLGIGVIMAYLYATYSVRAMGYIALYLLPGALLSGCAVLLCARESLRMSGYFFGCLQGKSRSDSVYPVRLYIARYLAATVLCTAGALLESAVFRIFAGTAALG